MNIVIPVAWLEACTCTLFELNYVNEKCTYDTRNTKKTKLVSIHALVSRAIDRTKSVILVVQLYVLFHLCYNRNYLLSHLTP